MAEPQITKEIETRTVRHLSLSEVEEALRDQYDLHPQDDITFDWQADGPGGPNVGGVKIIHIERTTE